MAAASEPYRRPGPPRRPRGRTGDILRRPGVRAPAGHIARLYDCPVERGAADVNPLAVALLTHLP